MKHGLVATAVAGEPLAGTGQIARNVAGLVALGAAILGATRTHCYR